MLRRATAEIARVANVIARSKVYETAPVGHVPQGPFLNAALLVDYEGSPLALLDRTLEIERSLGRTRDVRWGPRSIDIDMLWIDGCTVDDPRLVVPHPFLHERAFAIAPLLDVAPAAPYACPDDRGVRATDLVI